MKKDYVKPTMEVVLMSYSTYLLAGSNELRSTSTNLEDEDDLDYGGGGAFGAR